MIMDIMFNMILEYMILEFIHYLGFCAEFWNIARIWD